MSLGWPVLAPVAAAGLWREAGALAEQSSPQLVEPGAAHPQMRGGSGGVERPRYAPASGEAAPSIGIQLCSVSVRFCSGPDTKFSVRKQCGGDALLPLFLTWEKLSESRSSEESNARGDCLARKRTAARGRRVLGSTGGLACGLRRLAANTRTPKAVRSQVDARCAARVARHHRRVACAPRCAPPRVSVRADAPPAILMIRILKVRRSALTRRGTPRALSDSRAMRRRCLRAGCARSPARSHSG